MKRVVFLAVACLTFAASGCAPEPGGKSSEESSTAPTFAEFRRGPVIIAIRPDYNGADYEIEVDPWQADVQHSQDITWTLRAPGNIQVDWGITGKQGPWGKQDTEINSTSPKQVGPFEHPGGGLPARGRYNILLRITEDGETTVIRLDPDHRVWP